MPSDDFAESLSFMIEVSKHCDFLGYDVWCHFSLNSVYGNYNLEIVHHDGFSCIKCLSEFTPRWNSFDVHTY
jgi:hypothetical protein